PHRTLGRSENRRRISTARHKALSLCRLAVRTPDAAIVVRQGLEQPRRRWLLVKGLSQSQPQNNVRSRLPSWHSRASVRSLADHQSPPHHTAHRPYNRLCPATREDDGVRVSPFDP